MADVTVSVRLEGREPYGMFELVATTSTGVRVRGPLMLELGEEVALRFTRAGRSVDADGKITAVARGDGHDDPITTVELADSAALAPLGLKPEA